MNEVKATGNKILINYQKAEKEKKDETTASGIILERKTIEKDVIEAEVLSIGIDVREVNIGDVVVVEKQTTKSFWLGGNEYTTVPEPSVLGYRNNNENIQSINEDKNE